MKLALRELRRRPGRFVTATVILFLIAMLLMFLGGLVDGLINNSTGAVRAQRGDLIVFSSDAKDSFLRSEIPADLRATVESVEGVTDVGGIGIIQLGARVPGKGPRDLADTALFGYELAPRGVPDTPPAAGEAYADESLEAAGVEVGMEILLGPFRTPITIVGFVEDTNYLGQSSLWASPETWRTVAGENRSVAALAEGVFQSLVVVGDGDPRELARRIDDATAGATSSLTISAAADSIPGVKEQRGTFGQIIGVTVAIAVVVVALFFALLTIERTGLYGVLKAIGAGTATLFFGVLLQAVIVTFVATAAAGAISFLLDVVIPAGAIPFQFGPPRFVLSAVLLLAASTIGCAFSLRRVLKIDPARAIGGSL